MGIHEQVRQGNDDHGSHEFSIVILKAGGTLHGNNPSVRSENYPVFSVRIPL